MQIPLPKTTVVVSLLLVALLYALMSANTSDRQLLDSVDRYYAKQLDSLESCILLLDKKAAQADQKELVALFEQSRHYFKKAEALIEYHFPASAQRLNGAALLESEASEPNEPIHPMGFQVLEEVVYGDINEQTRQHLRFEISNLIMTINRLQVLQPEMELTEGNILDALRLNIYRMMIKGITGFDNPVALKSLREAVATLSSTKDMLSLFPRSTKVIAACDKALSYVRLYSGDFDAFDRAVFISNYINPLCVALYDYQQQQHITIVQQSKAISIKAKTLFEENAINPLYFAPEGTAALSPQIVALGKKLFSDATLSSNGKRSCASCHQPGKAFTDGMKVNESLLAGQTLMRNTPTLLNAGLQPVQFYDSRIAFLEDQAHEVISNRAEMGGAVDAVAQSLGKDQQYQRLFQAAFKDKAITGGRIKKAIAAYVRSLNRMNSPFDKYMRGNSNAMTAQQIRGFNLFAGKAKCATCHFIPLFSGTVPPLYNKTESEVLGIPVNTDTVHAVMDTDSGKYLLYGIPHQLYSFKTVSVRNAAVTAPYMHNGVYQTLEEVIDFYDRGGGAGLGFALPNQTLPEDRLHLTPDDKKALVAFLHALTDTTGLR